MESSAEITRDRRFKHQRLTSHWMMECQTEGMKTHAGARVVLMAIFSVTHNRMTDVSHMDTDLVLSSCEQMQEKE